MKSRGLWILVLLAWLGAPPGPALAAPAFKLISPETLKEMLGDPQVMIIDVRTPSAYAGDDKMIKGAVRRDPGKVPTWAQTLHKGQKIVLYCS